MTEQHDNNTIGQICGIIFGLIVAALVWYGLSGSVSTIALFILSVLVFLCTSWGVGEIMDGVKIDKSSKTFSGVSSPAASGKFGLTDKDAWSGSTTTAATASTKTASKKTTTAKRSSKPVAKAATKKVAKKPAKPAGPARLKKPKGKADDLKQISGVGPKLEKTLNKLGFWHFSQIAVWKKADIAIVDDELSFKGRIERDDWVKQAKALAKKSGK